MAAPVEASHHGDTAGHLPPVQQNVELVGELELTGKFGDVVPGQIADLSVFKGFAYLNSWDEPSCTRGGTYVADIRNPSSPKEIGFLPAAPGYYHGEGAHVVTLDTPQFKGDLLAVNDEACSDDKTRPADVPETAGGFDLYDVSDPANPQLLIQNAGDRSPDGSLVQDPKELANSYHSVFVWQDGPRAFLVGVDNTELADVDIYDITDPRNPELINDFDPLTLPEVDEIVDNSAYGNAIFHHDMVVKRIGGRPIMSVSYWDAGYIQLDVSNPVSPTFIVDTDFDDPDPLTGFDPPEGNAHQSEFSHDNQFLLAADEDFTAFRLISKITEAPFEDVEFFPAVSVAEPIAGGAKITGETQFVGLACAGTVPDAPAPGLIALAERGVPGGPPGPCAGGFEEKINEIEDAGYAMAIIFNNTFGAPPRCESLINMQILEPEEIAIPALFVGRADAFKILGTFDEETYQCTGGPTEEPTDTDPPPVGSAGLDVSIEALFDSWGYAHLYDAQTGEELDAFAIPEALDDRFAIGFGDLSIHEFATDPTENLAYSSYYSGGIRVFRFSRENGLQQVGAWIDDEGSNFWGIEQFTTPQGQRLIAGSDRDFGLQIFRYTGPGAAAPPSCSSASVKTTAGTPVAVPLSCTDANGNVLTRRITGGPAHGSLGAPGDSVTYTPAAGFSGSDSFSFVANDGVADSPPASATIDVAAAPPKPTPSNRFKLKLGKYKNGRVIFTINVESPGTVRARLQANLPRPKKAAAARVVKLASTTRRVTRPGTVRVALRLSKAKRKQLNAALKRDRDGRMRASLRVSFDPTGLVKARTTTHKLTLRN